MNLDINITYIVDFLKKKLMLTIFYPVTTKVQYFVLI